MTELAFRVFPAAEVVALFEEAPGGGEPSDINALRNRPALNPEDWLANLYFHSALDNMEVAFDATVNIDHAEVPVATAGDSGTQVSQVDKMYAFVGSGTDHELLEHNLGYPPLAFVAVGTDLICPGYPIEVPGTANGSARYVSLYVTTTKIFLREFAARGDTVLPAVSVDYQVLVIAQQQAPSGDKAFEFDPDTGVVSMARNRFLSSRRYLQVVPGGTPFGLVTGRTMDAKNGGYRILRADGTWLDPVGSTARQGVRVTGTEFASDSTWGYGPASTYTGTFTGSETIEVQAP